MEAQLFSVPISLKQTCLNYFDTVADVLIFGDVAAITAIV